MTYHYKAFGLAAALALSPMAASAATVDINIQSFGGLGSLSNSSNDPDIAAALAARDAFIGGATILATEDFDGFTGENTAGGLETAVGTFNRAGTQGTGDTVSPTDQAVVKQAGAGSHIMGRYNVDAGSDNTHIGGSWLDSNDWTSIEWSIPGVSGLTKFNRIAFFLTDVNDSGNTSFTVTEDGEQMNATITGSKGNGTLNLVTMQFADFVTGDLLISMTNTSGNTSDGFGVDTLTVAAVPLPAAGWLMLAGFGGLAALRRRKQAA